MSPTQLELRPSLVQERLATPGLSEHRQLWQAIENAVWQEGNSLCTRRCFEGLLACRHQQFRPLTLHPIIRSLWDKPSLAVLAGDRF